MKLTKKEFTSLHKGNSLLLVQGGIKKTADEVFTHISLLNPDYTFKTIPTTRIDVNDQLSTGYSVLIFKKPIHGKEFIIVQETVDNSKNQYVSWDTTDIYSTVFIIK